MKKCRKWCFIILIISFGVIICCCNRWNRTASSGGLFFIGADNSAVNQSQKENLVVVVHGWLDKGNGDWPEDMAKQIAQRVDCNQWDCGYFNWSKGAGTINPTDAAKYGRDIAGRKLADEILNRIVTIRHIHLIAHSSGCWVINEAARILAEKTDADLHLTFLDCYVPTGWDEDRLGNFPENGKAIYWTEQYFTRDYTFDWTQRQLKHAHNVDITNLDAAIKDHKFPWRWYYATITGHFPKSIFGDGEKYRRSVKGIEYGFALSKEAAGQQEWQKIIELPAGNTAEEVSASKDR